MESNETSLLTVPDHYPLSCDIGRKVGRGHRLPGNQGRQKVQQQRDLHRGRVCRSAEGPFKYTAERCPEDTCEETAEGQEETCTGAEATAVLSSQTKPPGSRGTRLSTIGALLQGWATVSPQLSTAPFLPNRAYQQDLKESRRPHNLCLIVKLQSTYRNTQRTHKINCTWQLIKNTRNQKH